jgi:hypothetical protein
MSDLINKLVVPVGVILALIGVIFVWVRGSDYEDRLAQAGKLQAQVQQMQLRQQVSQRLAQDLLTDYQQTKNEGALRILVASGVIQQQQAPATSATTPAARPSTAPTTSTPRSR